MMQLGPFSVENMNIIIVVLDVSNQKDCLT